MTIYNFKRVVLNQKCQAFFLEIEIKNECTLNDLLEATEQGQNPQPMVRVFFDIYKWDCNMKCLISSDSCLVKQISKTTKVHQLGLCIRAQLREQFNIALACVPAVIADVDPQDATDPERYLGMLMEQAVELDSDRTLADYGINRYSKVRFVPLKISLQLIHEGEISNFIEIPITKMKLTQNEFLPMAKEAFQLENGPIGGIYSSPSNIEIGPEDILYAG